jgi:hypothetical protein
MPLFLVVQLPQTAKQMFNNPLWHRQCSSIMVYLHIEGRNKTEDN